MLFTIYSPQGEMFEVTRLNFLDLTNHAGWSNNPPQTSVAALIAADTPAPAPQAPETATEPQTAPETADSAPETAQTADSDNQDAAPKQRLTEEDFADLTDKKDVFAYIEATFPGNRIDGRANRDKLIAIAIELAKAA